MGMKLVINDLKKLLDKNALLMSIMALICTFIAIYTGNSQNQDISTTIDLFRIDGSIILFVMFGVELSKTTLVSDKISKKLEFFLANGFSIKTIIGKYLFSIYLVTFITILPSLILNLLQLKISLVMILNFLLSSILYTVIIVLMILYTIKMDKINSLQIKLIGLTIAIIIISILVYNFTDTIGLYLLSKVLILLPIILFLGINTDKERIVVSYY